jgi:hypothetical protein
MTVGLDGLHAVEPVFIEQVNVGVQEGKSREKCGSTIVELEQLKTFVGPWFQLFM